MAKLEFDDEFSRLMEEFNVSGGRSRTACADIGSTRIEGWNASPRCRFWTGTPSL